MQRSLDGKRIIITGGTAGIGQGIALLAAAEGAEIAFCGHSHDGADQTFAAVEKAGGRSFFRALDLSDEEAARQFGRDLSSSLAG